MTETKNNSVKKSEVVKAVKELNETLGLDPQIKTSKKKLEELKDLFLQAAEFIEPQDEITEETLNIIERVAVEKGKTLTEEGVEELPVKEEEIQEPEQEEEEIQEPEQEKEPVEEKERGEKEGKEEKKEAATTTQQKKEITRPKALVEALKETQGQEFTSGEIIEASKKIYEKINKIEEKDNRGAKAEWGVVRGILVALELLEKQEQNKYIFKG